MLLVLISLFVADGTEVSAPIMERHKVAEAYVMESEATETTKETTTIVTTTTTTTTTTVATTTTITTTTTEVTTTTTNTTVSTIPFVETPENSDIYWWTAHIIGSEMGAYYCSYEDMLYTGACFLNRYLYFPELGGGGDPENVAAYPGAYGVYSNGSVWREPSDRAWQAARELLSGKVFEYPWNMVGQSNENFGQIVWENEQYYEGSYMYHAIYSIPSGYLGLQEREPLVDLFGT